MRRQAKHSFALTQRQERADDLIGSGHQKDKNKQFRKTLSFLHAIKKKQ